MRLHHGSVGGQQEVDAAGGQLLQVVPGFSSAARCPVVSLEVVGLVESAAGASGIAAEGQVAPMPFHNVGEGAGRVSVGGDAAEARRADEALRICAHVRTGIRQRSARGAVAARAAGFLVGLPELRQARSMYVPDREVRLKGALVASGRSGAVQAATLVSHMREHDVREVFDA